MVEHPKRVNVVDWKCIFHIKKNSAGDIKKYKVHLVAQGVTQVYGINYNETFTLVAKLVSIWTILEVAQNNWEINCFDFHSAYLNGKLDEGEQVYMKQPPEFKMADRKMYVLLLKKVLYGLKQDGMKHSTGHSSTWVSNNMMPTTGFSTCTLAPTSSYLQFMSMIVFLQEIKWNCGRTSSRS